jgi:5'-nucleotidase
VRILVTNDDGVHAPGLGALTRALAKWVCEGAGADDRSLVVVAPLRNHSGASAAVGTVFERTSIPYRMVRLEGAEEVPTYGLDASPALSTIVAALGGVGPRPDLVVSGINLGVNVGRSILHSGTVGAVLTGAQLGLSGLAVSMRAGMGTDHWETAADLAAATVPVLAVAPRGTVLNLNVPSLPPHELRGVRRARISGAGIIKAATDAAHPDDAEPAPGSGTGRARRIGGVEDPGDEGEIVLELGAAVPSLGDVTDEEPGDDGALVAASYAALTPVVGVREAVAPDIDAVVAGAIGQMELGLRRS